MFPREPTAFEQQLRVLRTLEPAQLRTALELLDTSTIEAAYASWYFHALPHQIPPPGDWYGWMLMLGRGGGKTQAANELVHDVAAVHEACAGRIGLIGATAADVRDTMVRGVSGLEVSADRRKLRFEYVPSLREVRWRFGANPKTSITTVGKCYSSEEPRRLRGPNHGFVWGDEVSAWENAEETHAMMEFGLRLGAYPRFVYTLTPKNTPLVKRLVRDESVIVTHGSTLDNPHLHPDVRRRYEARFAGTRIGRQELYGELLEDEGGALVPMAVLEQCRVRKAPDLAKLIVSVDPAGSTDPDAAETGIVVVGRDYQDPPHAYVLADCSVHMARPEQWGATAVSAYREHQCDLVIGERNYGGDMVKAIFMSIDATLPYEDVLATRGKRLRAEPVGALYERGRVHHVGLFADLEKQLSEWIPGMDSPDRLDALVHAITYLLLDEEIDLPASAYLRGSP